MNTAPLASKIGSTSSNSLAPRQHCGVLVVSARAENRKSLLRILEGLPIDAFVAATIEQAQEFLKTHSIEVVFCEEPLPDGSYRKLLEFSGMNERNIHFVVMLCSGEWDEYLEAMRLGATDVIRCPLQSIEVEYVLIRAGRERNRQPFDVMV